MVLIHLALVVVLTLASAYVACITLFVTWASRLGGGRDKVWPWWLTLALLISALGFISYNPDWLPSVFGAIPLPTDPIEALR